MPSLLPLNASKFEIGADQVEERLLAIPAPITDLWHPDRCPAALLPYLAWGLGVDLWEDDWPEGRKRRMCWDAIALKRLKGTFNGVQRYLAYIDAEIVDAVLPPQGVFARQPDPERQRRFRERFAQLRIYPFRIREQADARGFYAGRSYIGSGTASVSTAWKRYGKRAVIWDRGEETAVRWGLASPVASDQAAVSTERIVIPARMASADAVIGRFFLGGRGSWASSRAPRSRMLSLGVERTWNASGQSAIAAGSHGLSVLSTAPERVLERGEGAARGFHTGSAIGSFIARNDAALRIYDRFTLFDETRSPRSFGAGLGPFAGSARLGIKPFTAHFRIRRDLKGAGKTFYVGSPIASTVRQAQDRAGAIARALQAAAVFRDSLKFTTKTRRIIGFADIPAFAAAPAFGAMAAIRRRA